MRQSQSTIPCCTQTRLPPELRWLHGLGQNSFAFLNLTIWTICYVNYMQKITYLIQQQLRKVLSFVMAPILSLSKLWLHACTMPRTKLPTFCSLMFDEIPTPPGIISPDIPGRWKRCASKTSCHRNERVNSNARRRARPAQYCLLNKLSSTDPGRINISEALKMLFSLEVWKHQPRQTRQNSLP